MSREDWKKLTNHPEYLYDSLLVVTQQEEETMDRSAFEAEMHNRSTLQKARWVIRRILGTDACAEDVLQDACLLAWKGRHTFNGQSQFSTWFCTIARNAAIMHRRNEAKRERGNHAVENAENNTERRIALRETINRAISRLSKSHQEALRMSLTKPRHTEAATATGIPVQTYRTRLHYARKALREALIAINA